MCSGIVVDNPAHTRQEADADVYNDFGNAGIDLGAEKPAKQEGCAC